MLTTARRIVEGYFGGLEIREATDPYHALRTINDESMRTVDAVAERDLR